MLKKIRKIASELRTAFRYGVLRFKLSNHQSDNKNLNLIVEAIQDTILDKYSSNQKRLFEKIERRRTYLLNLNTPLNYMDYGAGQSNASRNLDQAEQGVTVPSTVANIALASKSRSRSLLLNKLVTKFNSQNLFEMGTCVGISGAYLTAAIVEKGSGVLTTMEGSPEVAKVAIESFNQLEMRANVEVGSFQSKLVETLERIQPVDFVFNDGHHDGDAMLRYFEKSLPFLTTQALLVFDDINWSHSMRSAFEKIQKHPKVTLSIDCGWAGIVIVGGDGSCRSHHEFKM